MEKKLFGTDGIRGVAGEPPLDPRTVFVIGCSLGEYLRSSAQSKGRPTVLMAEDTRESSRWIAETLAAGLRETGATVNTPGVLTTPGLAYVASKESYSAGVMISASHNPYQDNGIKVFGPNGFKLPDADELRIEKRIFAALEDPGHAAKLDSLRVALKPDHSLAKHYLEHLSNQVASDKPPVRKVIIDCANGAACAVAPEVFGPLGMDITYFGDRPDGRNINLNCGSLHLEFLQREVVSKKADLGIAFDGDADRALFVNAKGEVVNGDGVLLVAARFMKARGTLRGGAIVGTIMSNLGLERVLESEGLRLIRTPVGDKYVLEEMLRSGVNLGGEQSGHIIFSDLATTGDGVLTALEILHIMSQEGQTLERLVEGLKVFPQVIRNIPVRERVPLEKLPPVMEQIRDSERILGSAGRIIVRYSGTELLARVMVEAQTDEQVEHHAGAIVRAFERAVGQAVPSAPVM